MFSLLAMFELQLIVVISNFKVGLKRNFVGKKSSQEHQNCDFKNHIFSVFQIHNGSVIPQKIAEMDLDYLHSFKPAKPNVNPRMTFSRKKNGGGR